MCLLGDAAHVAEVKNANGYLARVVVRGSRPNRWSGQHAIGSDVTAEPLQKGAITLDCRSSSSASVPPSSRSIRRE